MDKRESEKPERPSHERRVKESKSLHRFRLHRPTVGDRADNAFLSYEIKHLALLPKEHWILPLITCHVHQCGYTAIATTVAKTRKRFWILKAHDLAKSVKFKCVFCPEIQMKVESHVMADLPEHRLAPLTPPFYYNSCHYFGPYNVKVYLELPVDYSTMEFIQVLRRFFAVRGRQSLMISDNDRSGARV